MKGGRVSRQGKKMHGNRKASEVSTAPGHRAGDGEEVGKKKLHKRKHALTLKHNKLVTIIKEADSQV